MNERPADRLAIAVAQLNPIVGDVTGNLERARAARAQAARDGADIVAFSELFIAGYPPEDLVLKPAFQSACRAAIETLARETADGGPAVLIGTPWVEEGKLYNAYALLAGGRIEAIRFKVNLPNYGVFDEKRVFASGPVPGPMSYQRRADRDADLRGTGSGATTRTSSSAWPRPAPRFSMVPNGSPYWRGKAEERLNMAVAASSRPACRCFTSIRSAARTSSFSTAPRLRSMPTARSHSSCRHSSETVLTTHWSRTRRRLALRRGPMAAPAEDRPGGLHRLHGRVARLCRQERFQGRRARPFRRRRFGACARRMAVDALGADRVRCVMLPYRYTSQESLDDAAAIARALGVHYDIVPIESAVHGLEAALARRLRRRAARRHRGKSAVARPRHHPDGDLQQIRPDGGDDRQQIGNVGRLRHALRRHERRLQSDQGSLQDRGVSAGAAAQPLEAGRRARPRRAGHCRERASPARRAPSCARTRPIRIRLPPYDVLDQILERLVEREEPLATIIAAGFDRETVMKIERMLSLAEYKRRQAAPGVKVTLKNFGRDRRYPIVNRFRDPGTALPEPDRHAAQKPARPRPGPLSDLLLSALSASRLPGHEGRSDRAHGAFGRHRVASAIGVGGAGRRAARARRLRRRLWPAWCLSALAVATAPWRSGRSRRCRRFRAWWHRRRS